MQRKEEKDEGERGGRERRRRAGWESPLPKREEAVTHLVPYPTLIGTVQYNVVVSIGRLINRFNNP